MLVKPDYKKHITDEVVNWDSWLLEYENNLKELGYRKYIQNYKHEDFCYWKTFYKGNDKIYQIGVLFYDFRKYYSKDPNANIISTMYQCMLLGDNRIDMEVSKDIDLPEFEEMSKDFYKSMIKYLK